MGKDMEDIRDDVGRWVLAEHMGEDEDWEE